MNKKIGFNPGGLEPQTVGKQPNALANCTAELK
jgi:hypothetical protein